MSVIVSPSPLTARDALRLETTARLEFYRESEQRALEPAWDRLDALGKLRATRRLVAEGVLHPRAVALGQNKVLREGARKLIRCLKDGTAFKVTHIDLGTSSAAVDETQTGTQAHVDAAAGKARIAIIEALESGYKTLNISSFIESAEYNGSTLREACLFDAATGGTAYNRVLFTTPLAKVSTDTAVANLTHDLVN